MKAAFYEKYGKPDVIEIREIEQPKPAKDEVLVRVKACTVNRTDCANLTGRPLIMHLTIGLFKPKKNVPGTDFAGIIEDVGSEVKEFKIGEKVWGFNDTILSSQAQFLSIKPKKNVFKIPEGVEFQNVAASAEAAHYAYYFYNKVKDFNCRILVNGGTGAIGSALIQMLKYGGSYVVATCRKEHFDKVESLGADELIDYQSEDFTKLNQKFDFVMDAVGKSSFGACKAILEERGIYISSELGPGNENIYLPLTTKIFSKKKVQFPFPIDVNESLSFVSELLQKGKFKPLIDKVYSLEQIQEAYTHALSGQKVGNLILKIED